MVLFKMKSKKDVLSVKDVNRWFMPLKFRNE